ncbi:4833_t:CDS:10 [Ambispora leptoticha]|uniref:4833_t:CDS:1 n=1 Tax=Ambispora leptoticha TaxID=144679 RepID=A0A9N8ZEK5_9GLOM|nr:4833_t:CDS:10 [Ambispora leptoticha]
MATGGPEIILTPEERHVFGQLFKAADEEGKGIVTGNRAIWQIADSENKGFLTPQTFSIAIKLIAQAQNGQEPDRSLINKESPLPHFQDIVIEPFTKGITNSNNVVFITNDDRDKYKNLFNSLHPKNGIIENENLKALWIRSKLPTEKLAQIWNLADTKKRGHLDLTEFMIAMYFVQKCMTNSIQTLPQTLPPGLYEEAVAAAGGTSSPKIPPAFSPHNTIGTTSPSPYSTGSPRFKQQQQSSLLIPRGSSENLRTSTTAAAPFFDEGIINNSPGDVWDVTPQDKANFDAYFSELDATNRGFITGKCEEAANFFLNSKLSAEVLAQIWDLANVTKSGRLTRDEFAVAMHLIYKKKAGGVLPTTLPPSLIPPSIRPTIKNAFSNLQRTDSIRPRTSTTNLNDPFFDPPFPTSTTNNSTAFQKSPEVDLLSIDQDIKTEIALETGEIRNLESQLTQLNNASTGLKARRNELESNFASLTIKKNDIKLRLTQLKALYEAEIKIVQEIEANYRKEHEATELVRAELASAERSLATLQLEKDQLQSGILKDREETMNLKKQIRLTEEETLTIKAQIEKLKKESRQHKGLLAINRKQLSSVKVEQEKSAKTLQKLQDEEANQQQEFSDPFANLQPASQGISEEFTENGSQQASHVHSQKPSIASIPDLGIKRTMSNASLDSYSTHSVSSSRSLNLVQANYEGMTSFDKPASVATSKPSELEKSVIDNASEISAKSNPFDKVFDPSLDKAFDNLNFAVNNYDEKSIAPQVSSDKSFDKAFDNLNFAVNNNDEKPIVPQVSSVQASLVQHEEKRLDPFNNLNEEKKDLVGKSENKQTDFFEPAQTNIDTTKKEDSLPSNDPFSSLGSFKPVAGNNKLDAAFSAFGPPPPETLTPDTFATEFPTLEELEKSLAGDVSLGFEDNFTEDKKPKNAVDNDINSKTGDEILSNSNQGLSNINFGKTDKNEDSENKDILSLEKIGNNESEESKIDSFNISAEPIINDSLTASKDSFQGLLDSKDISDPFTVPPKDQTEHVNAQSTAAGSNVPIAPIDDFDAAFANLPESKVVNAPVASTNKLDAAFDAFDDAFADLSESKVVNAPVASVNKFDTNFDAFDAAFADLSEAKVVNAPTDFDATFDENDFDDDFNPTFDTPTVANVKKTSNSSNSQIDSATATNFNSIDFNKAFDDFDSFTANTATTSTTLNTSKPNLDAAFGGSFIGSTTTKSETKNEFGFEDTFTELSKPPQIFHILDSTLPPPPVLPPRESAKEDNDSDYVKQLRSMGFTREQSVNALEKYDYDLEKASNYLIDQITIENEQTGVSSIRLPPETWQTIFADFKAGDLYRCLLVDRHWCSNVVSLLWRDPFLTESEILIKIYLAFLDDSERTELDEAGVVVPVIPMPTFEYPAFLKSVDYWNFGKSVRAWLRWVDQIAESKSIKGKGKEIESQFSIDLFPKIALAKEDQLPVLMRKNGSGKITYRSAVKRAIVKMLMRLAPAASKIVLKDPDDFFLLRAREIVKWCQQFQELRIVSGPLEHDKYPALCEGFINAEHVYIEINFYRQDWAREGKSEMDKLIKFINCLRRLTTFQLKLLSNEWIPTDIDRLCAALPKTLRHLSFKSVNFTAVTNLKPLTKLTNLETLEFECPSGLTDEKKVAPLTAAAYFPHLRKVIVRGGDVSDDMAKLQTLHAMIRVQEPPNVAG